MMQFSAQAAPLLARLHGVFSTLQRHWKAALIATIGLALAPALGWLASSGNIVFGAAVLGAMVVGTLMFKPNLSVWMIIVLPLWLGGVTALIGPLGNKIPWVVAVLSVILLASSIVQLAWYRQAPAFVWAILLFMAYAVLISVVSGVPPKQLAAGFKRYFQGHGLMFALVALPFAFAQVTRWRKAFTWLAFAQLPMCLFQLGVLVPLRGGFVSGEATDVVAGTFGGNLAGGSNNSDLAFFLIMSLGFVLAHAQEKGIQLRRQAWPLLLILAPLAMGETKIAVIMLPVCIMSVYLSRATMEPLRLVAATVTTGLLVMGLATIYAEVFIGQSLAYVIEDTLRYNFQEVGYGKYLLNRWTALVFWWDNHSWMNLKTLLFGHGLSASYSSMVIGDNGHVAARYLGFGIDLTAVAALLWDLGVVGLLGMLAIFGLALRAAGNLARSHASPDVRAEALGIRTALVLLMLYLPYNNSLVNLITTEVMFAGLLGYLAFLMRTHANDPTVVPHR